MKMRLCHAGVLLVLLVLLLVSSPPILVEAFGVVVVPETCCSTRKSFRCGSPSGLFLDTTTNGATFLDPLLTRILLDDRTAEEEDDDDDISDGAVPLSRLQQQQQQHENHLQISQGLSVWRSALTKGRLPTTEDFRIGASSSSPRRHDDDASQHPAAVCWPEPPALRAAVHQHMAALQLPRLVLRHPETANAVLLCLVRIVREFGSRLRLQQQQQVVERDSGEEEAGPVDDEYDLDFHLKENDDDSETDETDVDVVVQQQQLSEEELALLAQEVAGVHIHEEFGGVVSAVQMLDQIFGYNHGLVQGFGLEAGVWQHSGWNIIPELQQQIMTMIELRDLLKKLGRRPTVLESSQGRMHRFPPRISNPEGSVGAQLDATARSSVTGLTLSSSLAEMVPSEAVLLTGSSPTLRSLFWAKLVEAKLLSYELSGWVDTPSVPQRKRPQRLPSAPGGPLVVCLDTSWSMSGGPREWLSKAVVLASVSAAHRQRRPCHVVAFSQGIVDGGVITATPEGIQRLLEFLSHSFVGGTDVTGALQHAVSTILSGNNDDDNDMTAADMLLITDGEIPTVKDEIMQDLERLKRRTGLQIHGLLVGRSESKALEQLCTETHNFLTEYDFPNLRSRTNPTSAAFPSSSSSMAALAASHKNRVRTGWWSRQWTVPQRAARAVVLHAKGSTRKDNRQKRKFDDEDDIYYLEEDYWEEAEDDSAFNSRNVDDERTSRSSSADSFNSLVSGAVESIQRFVLSEIENQAWQVEDLDNEKNAEGSCWCYRDQFRDAVARISDNLVEREEESRLVVLGCAAGEHVLFLGAPGTAKSALGRRLANICGGLFFQRLLTRFTTPEELFGPLSLRALENDEYKRRTDGFLPKATVAFLDEIFKANSAILNTLLTILNERTFDNGAGNREECPIRCVIAASNELPESDELDALFDRFLLRKEVLPVSDDGIIEMLNLPTPGTSPCDTTATASTPSQCDVVFSDGLDRVVEKLSVAADRVQIGSDASFLLRDLRTFMKEDLDVEISDRRVVKAARLLKVSAASHGRTSVDPIDCLLLQHVAWRLPEQRSVVREWLWDRVTPGSVAAGQGLASSTAAQFSLVLNSLRKNVLGVVRKTSGDVSGSLGGRDTDITVIKALREEALQLASQLQQQTRGLLRHIELLQRSQDHLWIDPNEARAAQQLLIPKAESILLESNRVLARALSLAAALKEDHSVVVSNELRLSVIEQLWNDDEAGTSVGFSDDELSVGMKEAKARYDAETFRKWKRARKKAGK